VCLGFVDARAVVSKDFLALRVDAGIGRRSVAAGGVAVGGQIVLRRVPHFPEKERERERERERAESNLLNFDAESLALGGAFQFSPGGKKLIFQ
jgi:hypothetical protein